MDAKKIVAELKKQYPGKNIIVNDEVNPTEIICELEPGSWDPEKSVSIVVFDGKIKHPHSFNKETYEVIKGILEMTKNGQSYFLSEGQQLTIDQDEIHMAKGHETWVKVTSIPAWSPTGIVQMDGGTFGQ